MPPGLLAKTVNLESLDRCYHVNKLFFMQSYLGLSDPILFKIHFHMVLQFLVIILAQVLEFFGCESSFLLVWVLYSFAQAVL